MEKSSRVICVSFRRPDGFGWIPGQKISEFTYFVFSNGLCFETIDTVNNITSMYPIGGSDLETLSNFVSDLLSMAFGPNSKSGSIKTLTRDEILQFFEIWKEKYGENEYYRSVVEEIGSEELKIEMEDLKLEIENIPKLSWTKFVQSESIKIHTDTGIEEVLYVENRKNTHN